MKTTQELLNDALIINDLETLIETSFVDETATHTVNAISSVVNYVITDAFNLSPEDSMWVAYHLGNILVPLQKIIPTAVLAAVQKEIEHGEYSNRMFEKTNQMFDNQNVKFNSGVRYAPISDWVESVSEIVLGSYPELRPMIRSSIIGGIHGLFIELGVGENSKTSRPSCYLPNGVRFLLRNKD